MRQMTAAIEHEFLSADIHPIDMVETLAEAAEWEFDRIGENQIAMAVEGSWRVYSLNLDWSSRDDTLRLICSCSNRAPPTSRPGASGLPLSSRRRWRCSAPCPLRAGSSRRMISTSFVRQRVRC
jgi:hypothetical protein